MTQTLLIIGERIESLENRNWQSELDEWTLSRATSFASALNILRTQPVDCVLFSLDDTTTNASLLLENVQAISTTLPVLFISATMTPATATRLVRAGAWDCIGTSDTVDSLRESLARAAEEQRTRTRQAAVSVSTGESWRASLIGESSAMESVAQRVRLIGPRRCTVLISGETGTGKEVTARAIHQASPRANLPMVAVNCSALPENLLEAELFGHTKGAFTGAANHRTGRFEQAHNSTLFLDEIGDMPLELQAKLLRALQEREIQRLGSSQTIKVDVRVIAATNVDLPEKIKQGKFREDLYYRINVVPLRIPALRTRKSDIPVLAAHLVKKICRSEDIPLKRLSPEAIERLRAQDWPGNVRQLENAIEMAVAISGDREVLHPVDFGLVNPIPSAIAITTVPQQLPEGINFDSAVSQFEFSMLEAALARSGGNKTAAAEHLGIKRTTLIMKMRSLQQSGTLLKAG